METVESQEYDENVTTRWCTFEDFKKYCYRNLTEQQKMEEWQDYKQSKTLKILKEAQKYMIRNKHSYKKLAGDGLFSDVQVSRKIWARKESLH